MSGIESVAGHLLSHERPMSDADVVQMPYVNRVRGRRALLVHPADVPELELDHVVDELISPRNADFGRGLVPL